jgi:hypothetical protein
MEAFKGKFSSQILPGTACSLQVLYKAVIVVATDSVLYRSIANRTNSAQTAVKAHISFEFTAPKLKTFVDRAGTYVSIHGTPLYVFLIRKSNDFRTNYILWSAVNEYRPALFCVFSLLVGSRKRAVIAQSV